MAYIFRIHKGPEAGGEGWQPKGEIIVGKEGVGVSSILDSMDYLPASGKVGTSIPTPLARIYLFRTAFLAKESKDNGVYGELVSDCLDLLQFLFEKGEDPALKVYVWDAAKSISDLKNAGYPALTLLGDSLKMALDSDSETFSRSGLIIYLIEYDGVLLGGTSPFSLVFTSPNLRRVLREKRAKGEAGAFSSNKRVEFFNLPRSLKERPVEFREYLLSMTKKFNREFIAAGPLRPFTDYVERQTSDLKDVTADIFDERYKNINCMEAGSTKTISVLTPAMTPLCYNAVLPEMKESHFLMKPTCQAYKEFMKNTPLVLPTSFSESGWIYVDEPWDVRTEILDRCCKGRISERRLPKNGSTNAEFTNMQYPWVSNCDFFTDRLIDLTYDVNVSHFFNNANTPRFLLPIRKEYFWFFTVDDLRKNLKMTVDAEKIEGTENVRLHSVKVDLTIPLDSARGKITLSRTYTDNQNDSYTIRTRRRGFGLGIFPFYRLDEKNTGLKNEYSVYMFDAGDRENAIDLHFYSADRQSAPLTSAGKLRSQTPAGLSKVYNLRSRTASNAFDFIEVEVADDAGNGADTGLVVPIWPEQQSLDIEGYSTIFSIDFGTSNTHIAYWDPKENKVKPFEIDIDEQQMVLLNAPYIKDNVTDFRRRESFGRAADFTDFLREFVPSVIGPDSRIKKISYPVKTATLESNRFSKGKSLFENVNIGFDIDSEQVKVPLQSFIYNTNLKWALQYDRSNAQAKGRVEAYCEQTLWMLKNLIVLKGFYCRNIKILYFYPESMMQADKDMFDAAWAQAARDIFDSCGFGVDLKPAELESVAPYYSLLKRDESLYAYNSVNIDIGGGTTDIFLFDKKYEDTDSRYFGYEASIQFAGNDIWGKTYPSGDKNGFVEYMKHEIQNPNNGISEDLLRAYDNFGRKDNPEDMSSFFFKHTGYGFGDRIRNSGKLKYVLLLHYASILWYLSDMIKYVRATVPSGLDMPSRVTFTGKGSEYLKIISPKDDIITKVTFALLLAYGFTKEDFKDGFKVSYPDNPKGLTSEGGVYKLTADRAIKVNFVAQEDAAFGATDSRANNRDMTKYTNVGKHLFGFDTAEDGDCRISDIKKYKDAVMKHFNDFIDGIFSNELLASLLRQLNIVLSDDDRAKTIELASKSFDIQSERYIREYSTQGERLEGTIFFLAMKNTLIDLSLYYSDQIIKNR